MAETQSNIEELNPRSDYLQQEGKSIILSRFARAFDSVRDWHGLILQRRRMYNFDHYDEEAKPHEHRYPDPTPTNTVDLAVGILLSNEMVWKAYNWEPYLGEDDDTSNVEKFLAGALEINNEREQIHIQYRTALQMVRDGCSVLYSEWDDRIHDRAQDKVQIINEEDEMEEVPVFKELPLRVRAIDPMEMFVIPGGDKDRWLHVFRRTERTVYDVETAYNVKIAKYAGLPEEQKMTQKDMFYDYWRYATIGTLDGDEEVTINAVLFADDFVPGFEPRIMEGYDDIPYIFGFFKPVGYDKPEEWGDSIIDPLVGTVRFLEESINRRLRQITVHSSLPMVIRTQRGRKVEVDPGLEKPIVIDVSEDVGFPQWPGNAPDVERHIEFLRSRLQQSGFSDVMFGSGTSQVAGYALSQMSDQNRIRLEQPIAHLEMLWTTWARRSLRLVKSFASNSFIRVYGRMRGKDFVEQVKGDEICDFMVKCEIKPDFPNDKPRNTAMATQVAPFLSKRTILEKYLGEQQPDDERERQLIESAEEHPAFQLFGVISTLMQVMEDEEGNPRLKKAAAMTLEQLQQGALSGGSMGGQKKPNSPEQPMGIAGPTGQEPPQATGGEIAGEGPMNEMAGMVGAAPNLTGQVG